MEGVHAEIAHDAVLPVELGPPLPVDGLLRVEVARVEEGGAHLEHATVATFRYPAPDPLPTRVEGKLRGAADEQVGVRGDLGVDRLVRRQVDAEGLLAQEVLPS